MKQTRFSELIGDDFTPAETTALEAALEGAPGPISRPEHRVQVAVAMATLLPRRKSWGERLRAWYPWLLLSSQAAVLRQEIWLASALVLGLGFLITLLSPTGGDLLFSMVAPVVAAVGVAALYNDISQAMQEIEDVTRVSGPLLLLARLTLVFGYNLVWGVLISGVLVFFHSELSLGPLILSWLAPMTFLCGLAFFLSIVTADSLLSALGGLALWGLHLVLRNARGVESWLRVLALPWLADPAARPLLMLVGVALVAAALGILAMRERKAV